MTFLNCDKLTFYTNFISQKSYLFKKDELEKIRIDLTFSPESNDITRKQLDFIKNSLTIYPEIKPITYLLKRIFHIKQHESNFQWWLILLLPIYNDSGFC